MENKSDDTRSEADNKHIVIFNFYFSNIDHYICQLW